MDGTPTLADLRELMKEIENDYPWMDAETRAENRAGIAYVEWLLSEVSA
jgi:hypothetical protein